MSSDNIKESNETSQNAEIHKHPYMETFIALAVLTLIEVGVSYLEGTIVTVILLLLAVGKAVLVGAVFMHIKYDKHPLTIVLTVFVVPLVAGSILIFSVWRDWRGVAGA